MINIDIKEITSFKYKRPCLKNGYANQTLYINLTDNEISIKPVTEDMKRTFTGGKGFDLWLLWNAVHSNTNWNDPENEICIASGPLGGTPIYPGSGKRLQDHRDWPTTCYSNRHLS